LVLQAGAKPLNGQQQSFSLRYQDYVLRQSAISRDPRLRFYLATHLLKCMPEIFLTYDIRKTSGTIHTDLKNRLIEHYGYTTTVYAGNARTYDLPNTMLKKINTTTEQGSSDFLAACRDVGATWEKYIAVEMRTWTVNNQNP
jgi:hypothetical protein